MTMTTMLRSVAAAILLLLSLVSVGAYSPLAPKDSAVQSSLFRLQPQQIPVAKVEPRRNGIQLAKARRHVATLTAAALLWTSVGTPEAAHAARTRSKQKAAPVTRMTRVKQKLADYEKYAPAAGAVLVATGGGIILGRQTVPYADDDKEQEKEVESETGSATIVDEQLEKLNENKQRTLKILDRIAELETEDIIDQYQLRASAQEETQKILERIRLEREQQSAILKSSTLTEQEETQRILNRIRVERQEKSGILPPPSRPTTTTSYADQLPSNLRESGGGVESYTDKLSTNEIVNALIDQHAELAKKTQVNQPVESLETIDEAYASSETTVDNEKKEPSAKKSSLDTSAKSQSVETAIAESTVKETSIPEDVVTAKPSSKPSTGTTSTVSSPLSPSEPDTVPEKKVTKKIDSTANSLTVLGVDDSEPQASIANAGKESTKGNEEIVTVASDVSTSKVKADTGKDIDAKSLGDEKPIAKENLLDEQDSPTTLGVSEAKASVKEPEQALETKSKAPRPVSEEPDTEKENAAADPLEQQGKEVVEPIMEAAISAQSETTSGKPPATKERPKELKEKTAKLGQQSILGANPASNANAVDSKPVAASNGKAAIPLEQVYPVKSSQIQLDETNIASVKEKSAYEAIDSSLEEKAFNMLADLGMVELHPDPESSSYDSSKDDEFVE